MRDNSLARERQRTQKNVGKQDPHACIPCTYLGNALANTPPPSDDFRITRSSSRHLLDGCESTVVQTNANRRVYGNVSTRTFLSRRDFRVLY